MGDVVVAVARRVNVGLVPPAVEALETLMEGTGLNRTDVVNRALQLYAELFPYVTGVDGQEVLLRGADGVVRGLRFV